MKSNAQKFIVDKSRPIHVLRESKSYGFCWAFFTWLKEHRPWFAKIFRHTIAESRELTPINSASLFIPWFQDPLKERDPYLFERITALEETYKRNGVPVINPVQSLSNGIKSRALLKIHKAGTRTARCIKIRRTTPFKKISDSLGLPFVVRNDLGHGGYMELVQTADDFLKLSWDQLSHPLAMEFIDTRCKDGHYRKYRYLLTGDRGITRHLVISDSWNVHMKNRLKGPQYIREELDCMQSENPFHDTLNELRKVLELDYVAFDYSVDNDGHLVVWEPNPHPSIWVPANSHPYYNYQKAHRDRIFIQILVFYLTMASLLKNHGQIS